MPATLVTSAKVTGDCPCGAGGGGFLAGASELYDFPVRCGVGPGVGCWPNTIVRLTLRNKRTSATNKRKRIVRIKNRPGGLDWKQRIGLRGDLATLRAEPVILLLSLHSPFRCRDELRFRI